MLVNVTANPDLKNFALEISRGSIRGRESVNQIGINDVIASAAVEDVWSASGDFTYQTTEQALEILSSNAADTSAGTGARIVRVFGCDANYNRVTEDVTMNGTSVVAVTQEFLRIFGVEVLTVGSGGTNTGNITLRLASAGVTQALINASAGKSTMALYTIPAGFNGYLVDWNANLSNVINAIVQVELMTRKLNEAWIISDKRTISQQKDLQPNRFIPIKFPSKTDLRVRAKTDTNDTSVTSELCLILVSTAQPTSNLQLVSLKDDALPAGEVILVSAQANKRPFVQSLVLDKDGLGTSIEVIVGDTVILQSVSAAGVLVTLNGIHIGNAGEDIRVKAEGAGIGKYHITCGLVDEEFKGGELE